MAKANAEATAERVDHLQGMILAGSNNAECLVCARQTWGVSRAQGYKLVKRAWAQIKDDIDANHHEHQKQHPLHRKNPQKKPPFRGELISAITWCARQAVVDHQVSEPSPV